MEAVSTDTLPVLQGTAQRLLMCRGLGLTQCWGRLDNCVTDFRLLLEEEFLSQSTNSSRLRIPGLGGDLLRV